MVAQLNDLAYKAIQKGGLQKMLDKRALLNEDLYKKLDGEIDDITSKIDFEAVSKRERATIDEIGTCVLSCMDPVEAMEAGDCFGIGLRIERPEAAIADSSRVIVRDIVPTYCTVDSFLEAAKFKLQNTQGEQQVDVHGGFQHGG